MPLLNILKQLFIFLGGISFAIFLIISLAGVVILGTFLEAKTESHLYAAAYTYHHPLFALLLWLFFVNILFSSLRRWPFKKKHIPFLITHFGLLMIIGGTILKQKFGLQGHLFLVEGSGSQSVLLPYTEALYLEKKSSFPSKPHTYLLANSSAESLSWKIMHYSPHVQEHLQTWIKGDFAFFPTLPPVRLQQWNPELPISIQEEVFFYPDVSWDVLALRTSHVQEAITKAYLHGANVQISSRGKQKSETIPLANLIQQSAHHVGCLVTANLNLSYSPVKGLENPHFIAEFERFPFFEQIHIPLMGDSALSHFVKKPNWQPASHFEIDLTRKPLLLILQDAQGITHLFAFDQQGRVYSQTFDQASLQTLVVYDQGFGGYAAYTQLPFSSSSAGRKEKEQHELNQLHIQLEQAFQTDHPLAPPLELLKQACIQAKVNFTSTLVQFLWHWHQSTHPLLTMPDELSPILKHLKWNSIAQVDQQACEWIIKLFQQLESSMEAGEDLLSLLKRNRWPFMKQLESVALQRPLDLWSFLAQQLFSIADQLPLIELEETDPAKRLSAYLLAFGIQYHQLQTPQTQSEEHLDLEVPLTRHHIQEIPFSKWEDNRPGVQLIMQKGQHKQAISLAYDPNGSGLKWPIFDGTYLIRFQPHLIEIPYRLRLRQARQINYADSNQPYSYECDIIMSNLNQPPIEKTLSMNHVYETWDGYRFYLAGMSATQEGIKQVQIIVNRDPAKYYLTYPGAFITFCGILLLFGLRPYQWMHSKNIPK